MAAESDPIKVKSVAIILAAGSSSRMGQSKQLLKIGKESLLRKTIRTVVDSGVGQTVVVLGADEQKHHQEIIDLPVQLVVNSDWEKGMGSSLKFAILFVEKQFPGCETILVSVCDQPLLTTIHLRNLDKAYRIGQSPIVASFYSDSPGVPVLFHRSMLKKILDIDDPQGARRVIMDNIKLVSYVDFPDGAIDVDTPDDWKKLTESL